MPEDFVFGNTTLSPEEIEELWNVISSAKSGSQVTARNDSAMQSLYGKIENAHKQYGSN